MANSNGKITAPVSIADVATVLGLGVYDLGRLISQAKSGGQAITTAGTTVNAAYDVRELGGGSGVLLNGATPYHNIYGKGPTHWELAVKTPTSGDNLMVMEIFNRINKHPDLTGIFYSFNLADFNGYNHNAVAPSLYPEQQVINIGYLDSKPATVGVNLVLNPGSIDWADVIAKSGMSAITAPFAGIYKVLYQGMNIAQPNEGESATVDLSNSGEARIAARVSTTYFTAAGTYMLPVELKIGNTEALANPFRIDRWFTTSVQVRISGRPTASQNIQVYIDGTESGDATDLMMRNAHVSLYQGAGGSWSETGSYTNVKLSVGGEAMTFHNSATVAWYVTRGYPGDQASVMANGKLMKTATYSYTGPNGWSLIGINDFNLGSWAISDGDTLYIHAIITSYSG